MLNIFRRRRPAPVAPPSPEPVASRECLIDGDLIALRHHLGAALEANSSFGDRAALVLVDVDGTAALNDKWGTAVVDQVLAKTADRLRVLAPEGRTYRSGGDEFAVLLDPSPLVDVMNRAGAIQQSLSAPILLEGAAVALSVSIAVVMLGHRNRVDAVMRDADVTMFRAKTEGGNRVDIYNKEVDDWATLRRRDIDSLRREMENLRRRNQVLVNALTVDLETGMPNVVAFDTDHSQLSFWQKRTGEPYSLLRLHVEMLGAGSGDSKAMVNAAHAIRDTVRRSDRAYVLAPGEYAALLRGSTTKHALGAAERIIEAVHAAVPGAGPQASAPGASVTIAAIEAGFRHSKCEEVTTEVNALLAKALREAGPRIVWPH